MRVQSQFIEMFKNIPSVKIADCCITVSGGTPNTKKIEYYDGGDIPWLSSGEINQGYIFSTDKYITQLGLENSSAKWVPANSVVIAMYGATAGKVGFIKIPLTTNQAVCTLLPNDGFEPLYLYYATLSKTSWMISQCRGAAQPNISQSIIRSMEIPMATIDEQKRFCKLLTQADKSKFVGFKSQFIEMFGNPLSSKQKNELKKLGECCSINPRRPNINLHDTDKVSFVPMSAVSENGHLVDMIDEEYGKVKKGFTYFENNDVLFAKITPCMENGKGAIAHGLTNGVGMGSTEFHVLRPIDEISSPYWLLALTQMPVFRERAAKNMSGTGGQKRVGASYLEHFMVGLPSIEEQHHFEAIYKQADKSKYYN
ncbi:restriction endonuclease subunit S [Bacteroides gallinaceum]|uniref:restriction endonuclease subunit S n=1 Tax=Bacteroides gallinaceum TaxID=1462571 RepID=UPI0025AA6A84|nr:restriction endonuclease subunit S [Bacteroides gallinaceum]MDN0078305.1 restriction endonuclease subunit S [Bacteroides gallinaceum]